MSESGSSARWWRLHEILGALPVALWAGFHLWEQWAAFSGRDAWAQRMTASSHSAIAIASEIAIAIVPMLAWIALEVYLRMRTREPEALRRAMAEDETSAARLGLLARVASWIFFAWML